MGPNWLTGLGRSAVVALSLRQQWRLRRRLDRGPGLERLRAHQEPQANSIATIRERRDVLPRQLLVLATSMLFAVVPLALQAGGTPHWVHYKWLMSNPTLPKKVVVLPIEIKVVEVSAGGVEENVPDWSKEASQSVFKAVSAAITKQPGMKEIT